MGSHLVASIANPNKFYTSGYILILNFFKEMSLSDNYFSEQQ